MGNPGGDQGDGTVMIPRCPKCKEIFTSAGQMESHIQMENMKGGFTPSSKDQLKDVLRSKL